MRGISRALIIGLVLCIFVSANPKPAKAGVLVIAATSYFIGRDIAEKNSLTNVEFFSTAFGIALIMGGSIGPTALLIVLDGDNAQQNTQIAGALLERFPFLADQNEALNALAGAVSDSLSRVARPEALPMSISIPEGEVRELLLPTALTDAQIKTIIDALN